MNSSVVKFVISIVISVLLLYLTFQFFDIRQTVSVIKIRGAAHPQELVAGLALIVVAYMVRGLRWIIWERDLSYGESFRLILVGFMGNNIFPARLGEFIRAYFTGRKTGEGYGGTAALASIAIERILDGLVISLISIVGLALVSVGPSLFAGLLFVSCTFTLLTTGMIISIVFHERIRRLLGRIHDTFPGHLTRFGKEKANFFLDGMLLIRTPFRFILAIFASAVIWGIELVSYYLIAKAVFPATSFAICLIFIAVVNFASLFPFTVGGIGAIEGVTAMFLIDAGIPHDHALAMILIQHAFQFLFTTVVGGVVYFTGGYYNFVISPRKATKAADMNGAAPPSINRIIEDASLELAALSTVLDIASGTDRHIDLSIVIPAFNEQNRLPKTVLNTIGWCTRYGIAYELIISDDGSYDNTVAVSEHFAKEVETVRLISCPHQGKGATVQMGMLNARGSYVLFMDADGATPLDEIPKLLEALQKGSDVAIGSRVVQKPDETKVITALHRRIMGRIFNGIVNTFVIAGIADTQCGFKMFRKKVVKEIFGRQKIAGFAFDVEILFIARKLGFSVTEVPVNWENQEGSKVNIIVDSIKMFRDILKIRWLHRNEKWEMTNGKRDA